LAHNEKPASAGFFMRQICQRGLFFSRAIPYCLLKRIAHLNAPNFAILSKQLSFFFSLMLHASQKLASVLCPSITSFFFPFIYGLPLCCGQSFLLSLSLYCRLLRICFLLRQAMKNLARMTMVALVASSCFLFSSFFGSFPERSQFCQKRLCAYLTLLFIHHHKRSKTMFVVMKAKDMSHSIWFETDNPNTEEHVAELDNLEKYHPEPIALEIYERNGKKWHRYWLEQYAWEQHQQEKCEEILHAAEEHPSAPVIGADTWFSFLYDSLAQMRQTLEQIHVQQTMVLNMLKNVERPPF
jgi:hypothetical protein